MDGKRWELYHSWIGLLTAKPRAVERIQVGTKYALKRYRQQHFWRVIEQQLLHAKGCLSSQWGLGFSVYVQLYTVQKLKTKRDSTRAAVHLSFWGKTALPTPPMFNSTSLGTPNFYILCPIEVNCNHFILWIIKNNNKKRNSIWMKNQFLCFLFLFI